MRRRVVRKTDCSSRLYLYKSAVHVQGRGGAQTGEARPLKDLKTNDRIIKKNSKMAPALLEDVDLNFAVVQVPNALHEEAPLQAEGGQ